MFWLEFVRIEKFEIETMINLLREQNDWKFIFFSKMKKHLFSGGRGGGS
jgi:hypothetical protein